MNKMHFDKFYAQSFALISMGINFVYHKRVKGWSLYHPVWIDMPENLTVGEGTRIGPFVYITMQNPKGFLKIGKNCEVNPFSVFLCGKGIEIGDHVLISPSVKIISSTNTYKPYWEIWKNPHIGGTVTIEDNVHIGTNAVILPGVTIEEGCVIGAGAVVTESLPRGSIAVGVPAKVIKTRLKSPP
ncbi:MAG: hypothetical protein DRJ47_07885 [Thermoprotei archaeon]|nr:MAG: hypothetical protein DRJ47_07885 [Thermoprotei archaeon]